MFQLIVDLLAKLFQRGRVVRQPFLLRRVDGNILFRCNPGCGALIDGQLFHLRRDLRHELHRTCRTADHRNPRAAQIMVLLPAAGVKQRAAEIVQTGNLRPVQFVEHALRGDDRIGDVFAAIPGRQVPLRVIVVPHRAHDFGVQL